MAVWKNPADASLHDDMAGSALSLPIWPPEMVPLTDDEEEALSLAAARAKRRAALQAACATSITAGFSSAALGAAYTYPSAETDQANLVQAAAATDGGKLWCADVAGTWAMVAHTQVQALAVLTDFVSARNATQAALVDLTAQVEAAAKAEAVAAIVWPSDLSETAFPENM